MSDYDTGLRALLDTLIPPSADGRLPGAGQVGVDRYLAERATDLRPMLEQGLADLDRIAARHGADAFSALPPAERAAALTEYAEDTPTFLPGVLYHTYSGYYQQAAVVEGLGLEGRPPFPRGYDVEPTDLDSLLGDMRDRPKLFRE